ncbi:MAG: sulfite exporter TauE/SafE family protein [Hyphomicrobiaceae bacterium]|nr:sulfite exporter TauE/SafE family protein [Hyphomicrobiaceae bacterium]
MGDIDLGHIGVVAAGLTLAGVVKGATGLGYASSALPFLVFAVGLRHAMAIVLLPAMATNIAVALFNGHLGETWQAFSRLYFAMLPGILLGIWLLLASEPRHAVLVLGVTIVAYSLFALARPHLSLTPAAARSMQVPVGFLNGVLTGLTGSQVMPLVPYVMALDMDPARSVQAINLGVLLSSAALAVALVASGAVGRELLLASAVAVMPAVAGVEVGRRLRSLIPAEHFRAIVLLVLLASGIGMLAR